MIANKSKSWCAYRQLKEKVLQGAFCPSQRLFAADLATALDLGLTPVREALIRLCAEGYISSADGNGFRCAPISISGTFDLYQLLFIILKGVCTSKQACIDLPRLSTSREDHAREDAQHLCAYLETTYTTIARSSKNMALLETVTNIVERTRLVRLAGLECALSVIDYDELVMRLEINNAGALAGKVENIWAFKSSRFDKSVREAVFMYGAN